MPSPLSMATPEEDGSSGAFEQLEAAYSLEIQRLQIAIERMRLASCPEDDRAQLIPLFWLQDARQFPTGDLQIHGHRRAA